MRVAGLDCSTKSGVCFTPDGENFVGEVLHFKTLRGFTRLRRLAHWWGSLLDDWKPEIVVVEGYSYGSPGSSFSTLVEVGAYMRRELHERRIEWYDVPPSVVKKFACGRGNAKKPEVAEGVLKQWGYTHPSDDVIDAYVLVRIGMKIMEAGAVPANFKGVSHEGRRIS